MTSPLDIYAKHCQEWVNSAISPEIIELNLKSIPAGQTPYEYLLYSYKLPRTNTGRLSSSVLNRYQHLDAGGWWCSGIDVLTGEDSLWGCFKPNEPKIDQQKQKPIKYHHPEKVSTEIFALRIPVGTWQLIAHRYDVALPENYRLVKENPWFFWQWVINHPHIPLIITEGAKKAACILSRGYAAIALPGVRSGYRLQKNEEGEVIGLPSLIPQLQVFVQPGRRIYFAFDQDTKRNTRRDVNQAIGRTAKLFKQRGCTVAVMFWEPKLGKGIDDAVYNSSTLGLDKEEFFGIIYRNAQDFDQWESAQLRQLTYEVSQSLDRRYLLNRENPNDTLPPADAQFIALKAPKGTGKTEWMSWFTEPLLRSGEKRILLITHRIQLSTQTANRLGIPYVTQVKETEESNHLGMGLCIDSLHPLSQAKFKPDDWRNSYVIIDEVMQVIWHLLSSSTCTKERVAIIKTLKQLLTNVIKNGGKIIIADADLNDIAIDFIKGLIGLDVKTWIIENTYQFNEPWKVYNFKDKNPARMIALLKQRLLKGERHLLCVSGQKAKSRWGSIDLEAFFRKYIPELRILRIDSETVANPKHPAYGCSSNLNEIIKEYDLVIATPTIETGVSIEEEHFQGVWGIFQGVSTTDSVRQHLSRYRLPVPRYVWIKSVGIGFVGDKSTNWKGLIASQRKLDKAHINRLVQGGFEESIDGNFEPICLTTWGKLGAIINQGKWHYEQQIIADLAAEGHIIKDAEEANEDNFDDETLFFPELETVETLPLPDASEVENLKNQIDENREEQYQIHRESVAAAESIDDKTYETLKKQQARTDEELLKLKKAKLERSYNVEVTPDLLLKDDEGWYSQIRLHYYFDKGREFLNFKDSNEMISALKEGGEYFLLDTNKKMLGKKIDALDFLGISRLYEDTDFSKNHSVVQDIFSKCQQNAYNLKLVLGVDFSKVDSEIECIQRLLDLIGHKMPCIGRKGSRKERYRVYGRPAADFEMLATEEGKRAKYRLDDNGQAISLPDGREAVFEAWLQRDAEAKRKAEEEQAAALAAAEAKETERQQWLAQESLEDIVVMLSSCEEPATLQELRQIIPSYALSASAKLLPDDQRQKIRSWVLQQNAEAA